MRERRRIVRSSFLCVEGLLFLVKLHEAILRGYAPVLKLGGAHIVVCRFAEKLVRDLDKLLFERGDLRTHFLNVLSVLSFLGGILLSFEILVLRRGDALLCGGGHLCRSFGCRALFLLVFPVCSAEIDGAVGRYRDDSRR